MSSSPLQSPEQYREWMPNSGSTGVPREGALVQLLTEDGKTLECRVVSNAYNQPCVAIGNNLHLITHSLPPGYTRLFVLEEGEDFFSRPPDYKTSSYSNALASYTRDTSTSTQEVIRDPLKELNALLAKREFKISGYSTRPRKGYIEMRFETPYEDAITFDSEALMKLICEVFGIKNFEEWKQSFGHISFTMGENETIEVVKKLSGLDAFNKEVKAPVYENCYVEFKFDVRYIDGDRLEQFKLTFVELHP